MEVEIARDSEGIQGVKARNEISVRGNWIARLGLLFFGALLGGGPSGWGSINPKVLKGVGVVRGGQAGPGFSLLDIRSSYLSRSKTEKIVIEMGDPVFQRIRGDVGYYNLEMKSHPSRLVLDFSQTLNTNFSENKLTKVFESSPFIKSSSMYFNRMSQSMNLTLSLKKAVIAKVSQIKGGIPTTAQLIIELVDLR